MKDKLLIIHKKKHDTNGNLKYYFKVFDDKGWKLFKGSLYKQDFINTYAKNIEFIIIDVTE